MKERINLKLCAGIFAALLFCLVITVVQLAEAASTNFGIVANSPITYSENTGLITGAFTISRDDNTVAGETVDILIGGTAIAGIDYVAIATTTITFTTGTTETLDITIADDMIDEGIDETIIITLNNPSVIGATLTPISATLTIKEDDEAGFIVTPLAGTPTEAGGTATFTVTLNSEPTEQVQIPVSSSDISEGKIALTGQVVPTDSLTLTFTTMNWNQPQPVTITGQDDSVQDGMPTYDIVLGAPDSIDTTYSAIDPNDITNVTTEDNDEAGFIVTPLVGTPTEAGGTATFTVTLNSEPTAQVQIPISSSDISEGKIALTGQVVPTNSLTLTFTTMDWDQPQPVIITGQDDKADDGMPTYNIVLGAAVSTDTNYSTLDPNDVTGVTTSDDDECPTNTYCVFLPVLMKKPSVINSGFDAGTSNGWTVSGNLGNSVVSLLDTDGNVGTGTASVITGTHSAQLGDPTHNNDGGVPVSYSEFKQTITIPSTGISKISLQYRIFTHDVIYSPTLSKYFDTFEVYIGSASPLSDARRDDRCMANAGIDAGDSDGLVLCDGKSVTPTKLDAPTDLGTKTIDINIASRAGSSIDLIIRVYNRVDGKYNTWAYIDDIKLLP